MPTSPSEPPTVPPSRPSHRINAGLDDTRTVANREQRSTSVPSYVPVGDGNARTVETDADLERHRTELNIANTSERLRARAHLLQMMFDHGDPVDPSHLNGKHTTG